MAAVELHMISDSTGETAQRLVQALEAQFPEQEFDETMAQVKRWGLDQYLKERKFENLVCPTGAS